MLRHAEHVPFVREASYPLRAGCAARPLVDGEPAFRRICEAVQAARKSVWITVAFLHRDVRMPDGHGTFFDVLDRACARGVDVRVLFWRCPELEASEPGTHFSGIGAEREFLRERGSQFHARWDRAQKLYCQHQKSWLVDAGEPGEVAFVGGINLSQASMAAPGHTQHGLHDVYVALRGPCATDVHHNFVQRWNEASERLEADGCWPHAAHGDLPFPHALSPTAGDASVQIQRTVRAAMYYDATPAPAAEPYEIGRGEFSILAQYLSAIESARRTIYLENQGIGSLEVIAALHAALARGVDVVYLVPGEPPRAMVEALRQPKNEPFASALARLDTHSNFTLVALAASDGPRLYRDVYVHAKIALIDDAFCTIGSCNVATRSFRGDTELNASVWHEPTVRALRSELLREHIARDTDAFDDRAAYALYARVARANARRRAQGEPLEGLAFAIRAASYAR